jgi:hypothetical protein
MKKNSLKRIITICFFTILIVSCQKKSNLQIEEENYEIKLQSTIDKLEADNINQKIVNQVVYLGVDSLQSFNLKEFIRSTKLFLYFSSNTCSPCIDQTVEIIKTIFPDYETNNNIVFVSPDYPARYRINCYGKKLLNLENKKLGLPIESGDQPLFFFMLNNEMEIVTIHVVNKMDFIRTEQYLLKLKSEYNLYQ